MRRGREREREKKKAAGDGKGCSQRVDNFYNNHDTSIHVPPKEGKSLPGTGDNIPSWINQSPTERERRWEGGVVLLL